MTDRKWETHCEECGRQLTPDPDWADERLCEPCNITYLDPNSDVTREITKRWKRRR